MVIPDSLMRNTHNTHIESCVLRETQDSTRFQLHDDDVVKEEVRSGSGRKHPNHSGPSIELSSRSQYLFHTPSSHLRRTIKKSKATK